MNRKQCEITCPVCDDRLAIIVIWEFGTDERVVGRTDRRERFFVELLAFDRAFGAI
jgi:hypothetical protein